MCLLHALMWRPYRAYRPFGGSSQGFTLGCPVTPRWGVAVCGCAYPTPLLMKTESNQSQVPCFGWGRGSPAWTLHVCRRLISVYSIMLRLVRKLKGCVAFAQSLFSTRYSPFLLVLARPARKAPSLSATFRLCRLPCAARQHAVGGLIVRDEFLRVMHDRIVLAADPSVELLERRRIERQ